MAIDPHDENVESQMLKDAECEECGHPISAHTKYGCEIEGGDAWVTGNQPDQPTVLMAQGPCGCQAWEVETVDPLEAALERAYQEGKTFRSCLLTNPPKVG